MCTQVCMNVHVCVCVHTGLMTSKCGIRNVGARV